MAEGDGPYRVVIDRPGQPDLKGSRPLSRDDADQLFGAAVGTYAADIAAGHVRVAVLDAQAFRTRTDG